MSAKWAFTFGSDHYQNGVCLFKKYVVIDGEFNEARDRMFEARGAHWSFQYLFDTEFLQMAANRNWTEIWLEPGPISGLTPKQTAELHKAFSDYTRSEGCDCCRQNDLHNEAADRIAKLLNFKRYSDDSGWDWEWYPDPEQKL